MGGAAAELPLALLHPVVVLPKARRFVAFPLCLPTLPYSTTTIAFLSTAHLTADTPPVSSTTTQTTFLFSH